MKKMYGAPKAERVEFEYSNTVVASVTPCQDVTKFTVQTGLVPPCNKYQVSDPVSNSEQG